MLRIVNHHVELGLDNDNLLKLLNDIDPVRTERTQLMADLLQLWIALISKYGKDDTATFIEDSLKYAIEMIDSGEVATVMNYERNKNDKTKD